MSSSVGGFGLNVSTEAVFGCGGSEQNISECLLASVSRGQNPLGFAAVQCIGKCVSCKYNGRNTEAKLCIVQTCMRPLMALLNQIS